MYPDRFLILALLVTFSGCDFFNSSDEFDSDLFGVWYNIETVEYNEPAPNQRVTGWYISDENQAADQTLGSVYPVGIEGKSGQISLIDSRHTPSIKPQIHNITSDKIVLDYIDHINIARGMGRQKTDDASAISDLTLEIDTVKYELTPTQLILDGRYYKGTYNRSTLGNKITESERSEFTVFINGNEHINLEISETIPSAYISKLSDTDISIISRMGGYNLTIDISSFQGAGTYILGEAQASVTPQGFDTLSPSYVTVADSSGYVTIESIDLDNGNITGNFEFTAYMGGKVEETELHKSLRNGSFDLPLFN